MRTTLKVFIAFALPTLATNAFAYNYSTCLGENLKWEARIQRHCARAA